MAMRMDNQLWAGQPLLREDVQALADELRTIYVERALYRPR
jgi:hypothetical protein